MYPNLYFFFKDIFGISIPVLRVVNSFGFFVAISFLVAAALLSRELRRKSAQQLFQPTIEKKRAGGPATPGELIGNGILGFLMGYKLLGLFFAGKEAMDDPQAYIFSAKGDLLVGLLAGAVFAFVRYREKKNQASNQKEDREIRVWPYDRVGEFTMLALVFGLVGAKLFDIFENWSEFLRDPSAYIFSGGGLTFYGGLICATAAIVWHARKHKVHLGHLADAIAPSLMIAYAIGRIGCQTAGDGDWGIYNTAYKVDTVTQKIVKAEPGDFARTVAQYPEFFSHADNLHNASVAKPGALSFLPNWFFAYNYPHNVNSTGVPIPGCDDSKYCSELPAPVFPAPMYETIMGLILFAVLWGIRKKLKTPGALFAIYLFVNGLERFLIEKIRVNNKMNFLGFHPTQAEVISSCLMLSGILLLLILLKLDRSRSSTELNA